MARNPHDDFKKWWNSLSPGQQKRQARKMAREDLKAEREGQNPKPKHPVDKFFDEVEDDVAKDAQRKGKPLNFETRQSMSEDGMRRNFGDPGKRMPRVPKGQGYVDPFEGAKSPEHEKRIANDFMRKYVQKQDQSRPKKAGNPMASKNPKKAVRRSIDKALQGALDRDRHNQIFSERVQGVFERAQSHDNWTMSQASTQNDAAMRGAQDAVDKKLGPPKSVTDEIAKKQMKREMMDAELRHLSRRASYSIRVDNLLHSSERSGSDRFFEAQEKHAVKSAEKLVNTPRNRREALGSAVRKGLKSMREPNAPDVGRQLRNDLTRYKAGIGKAAGRAAGGLARSAPTIARNLPVIGQAITAGTVAANIAKGPDMRPKVRKGRAQQSSEDIARVAALAQGAKGLAKKANYALLPEGIKRMQAGKAARAALRSGSPSMQQEDAVVRATKKYIGREVRFGQRVFKAIDQTKVIDAAGHTRAVQHGADATGYNAKKIVDRALSSTGVKKKVAATGLQALMSSTTKRAAARTGLKLAGKVISRGVPMVGQALLLNDVVNVMQSIEEKGQFGTAAAQTMVKQGEAKKRNYGAVTGRRSMGGRR